MNSRGVKLRRFEAELVKSVGWVRRAMTCQDDCTKAGAVDLRGDDSALCVFDL